MRKKWVVLMISVTWLMVGSVQAGAIRSGFNSSSLGQTDDGSSGLVPVGFALNFFGATETGLYVNSNGNVTFNGPLWNYTPFTMATAASPIIAPFFADVDTADGGSPVTYGTDTVDGHAAFGVDWINVAFFGGAESTNHNSFQLVIIDRSDIAAGDFDFEFNYDQIQWEAGTASDGNANGLGGFSARAGYSNGSNTSYEISGSAIDGAFLDSNSVTGLVHRSFNSSVLGRFVFQARGGTVLGACSGVEGFEAQISALSISRSQKLMLLRNISIVNNAVQRENFYAAGKNCGVFDRKVQRMVSMGLIDQSTADSLISCCTTLASSTAVLSEEARLNALKGRLAPR